MRLSCTHEQAYCGLLICDAHKLRTGALGRARQLTVHGALDKISEPSYSRQVALRSQLVVVRVIVFLEESVDVAGVVGADVGDEERHQVGRDVVVGRVDHMNFLVGLVIR